MKYLLVFILLWTALDVYAQDHDLNYYIDHARANSPLLKDYQNQIASGRIDSELVKAAYKPQVMGISNNSYAPVIAGIGYDNAITNGGQLSAIVQANKTFVSKNNLASQYKAIRLQNETTGNTATVSEQDLKRSITTQYISVYGDFLAMNFNREILALFEHEEVLLKKMTESNIYRQSDYLSFYVSLQQQQLAFRQSEIQFKNDYATLNYLSGIVDTAAVSLKDPQLQVAGLPDVYLSAFYRQYTIDSLRFLNDRTIIGYSYKPKLNVFADAGYNSSLAYQGYKNFGTSFGLTLNVPIYDGRQKQLRYRKIDISERTRQAYRDFFLNQYDQQIAQLKQQLQATEKLIGEINGQIRYSKTLVDVNGKLLETGEVRITDLILAINTYLNARNLLNQNYISRLQIINQINYWNRQ